MNKLTFLVAAALVAASCGGTPDIYDVAPGAAANEFGLPPPVPAVPVFAVRTRRPLRERDLRRLEGVGGTAVVAGVDVARMRVSGRKGGATMRVGVVDPIQFRSVAPPTTRDADFVWTALLSGDAVVTHEAGSTLGVRGAKRIRIRRVGRVRVGAVADNGTPNVVDVLVGAQRRDLRAIDVAVVGARSGVTIEALGRDLRTAVDGAELTRLLPKQRAVVPRRQPAAGSAPAPLVAGLHPVMQQAVDRLIAAAGGRVWIVSGFRTSEHQYRLWVAALRKHGDPEKADNWVAPPGHSMHERGLAVDLGGDLELAARLIDKLGLPLWRPMSWEPWHFEVVGSRG